MRLQKYFFRIFQGQQWKSQRYCFLAFPEKKSFFSEFPGAFADKKFQLPHYIWYPIAFVHKKSLNSAVLMFLHDSSIARPFW